MDMATKNPRLQVVLEKPLYDVIASLAGKQGVSMSTKARDLIKEALERLEDMALVSIVEARAKNPGKFVSSREMRKRLGA
mgnify:CR=1 FL=1